jgi:5'-methylthioadenosine phosphorylase
VTIDMVIANLRQNVDTAKKILRLVIKNIPPARECACATALENAIVTAPDQVSPQIKKELALLIGKYLPYERKQ